MKTAKYYEVGSKILFYFFIFPSVLSVSRALSVHILKLFCTATVPASGASCALKINKQRCSSYINHSSPTAESLRKASTPMTLTKGWNVGCCLSLSVLPWAQAGPGDPSRALSGAVIHSRGRDSCLETRNVGEPDSNSLASSKVVENPGV